MTTLTPEETAEVEKMLDGLRERGYQDVAEHGRLKPGVRIRHIDHQWSAAYARGTGVVVAITEKNPSGWSQSWGKPDIELITLSDRPYGLSDSRLSVLAQYHVSVVEEQASHMLSGGTDG